MTSQHNTGTHPFLHRYVYTHIYTYLCTYIYFPEGMFMYFFTGTHVLDEARDVSFTVSVL